MSGQSDLRVHATSVALADAAVMLRGPSGAGKSDLALRFLADQDRWPAPRGKRRLVADDQTILRIEGGKLMVSAPGRIDGRLEVRGVGIIDIPSAGSTELRLVVDLVDHHTLVDRLPDPNSHVELLGRPIPYRRLVPTEVSASLKLALLLAEIVGTTTTSDGNN